MRGWKDLDRQVGYPARTKAPGFRNEDERDRNSVERLLSTGQIAGGGNTLSAVRTMPD